MRVRRAGAVSICVLVAWIAACGPGELTSEQVQALVDEELPPGTAEVLGVRQGGEGEAVATLGLEGIEEGEIDVRFAFGEGGWRPAGVELEGRSYTLAELVARRERARQRSTMTDMLFMASANGTMRVDTGRYAQTLAELAERGYLPQAPSTDAWGNAFVYTTGADTYTITSLGSNGAVGPAPPREWTDAPFEPDIVLTDGRFVQSPGGR